MDLPFTSTVHDSSESLERDAAEENDLCNSVLRYINQVLMEDDLEDKAGMIRDSTLHATEKSLYEILNQNYNSSPNHHLSHEDTSSSSDDSITHCCSNFSSSYTSTYNSAEPNSISDIHKYESSFVQIPSLVNVPLQNQSSWQYRGGIEESKNILPSGDSAVFGFEKNSLAPLKSAEKFLEVEAEVEKDERDLPESFLTGKKNLHREEESDLEDGSSNKHFADYVDESVLHEMFDKVLSIYDGNVTSALNTLDFSSPNEARRDSQQNERSKGSNFEMAYARKGASKREAVDMRSLLIQCMQSVAGNDQKTAIKLLKQIRFRSNPLGDGSQRLAHYFANSLKARLVGAGSLEYKALSARSLSDADLLKAYKLYLSTFPFMETSYFFSGQMIMELAERATSIHIIHFGIIYGVQWPHLIQCLSTRPGGPPKLRITGIDLPQSGFRPGARVKETGRRLAKYCEKFNVPFEYSGIAQKWETISVGDLRIEKDEVLVVNCLHQFMYLIDDTIMEHSPRDAVLKLIKRINPDIFIHGIVNGTYNSPFFISRFREALFYFSALFDMFEANVPRENRERVVFEREIWGNEILNVIACEGLERVERPETYKQWQIRTVRAGFRQLPLNQEIMKKVKAKLKSCYQKDFFVDEASQWMLEGWKGRVFFALSCWKPA